MNINKELFSGLTIILNRGETEYIKVNGTVAKVIGNVIMLDAGAKCTISHALESVDYITTSGILDSDLTWIDFQSNSQSIATISGTLLNTSLVAPSIIKVANTTVTSGTYRVKINLRGNRA